MSRRLKCILALILTMAMVLPAGPVSAAVNKGSYSDEDGSYDWEITGGRDDLTLTVRNGSGIFYGCLSDNKSGQRSEYTLADMKTIDLSSATNSDIYLEPEWDDEEEDYVDTPFKAELIKLPSSMSGFSWPHWLLRDLKEVTVEDGGIYSAKDGVLSGPYDYLDENGDYKRDTGRKVFLLYPSKKEGSSFSVPDGIAAIYSSAFRNAVNLETVNIPASVMSLDEDYYDQESEEWYYDDVIVFHGCSKLKAINVDESNTKYSSESGVLFNKDKKTILKYPEARDDKDHFYAVPATVTKIACGCFRSAANITALSIGKNVTVISKGAFGYNKDTYYGFRTPSIKDIYYEGSEAEWKAMWEEDNNEDSYLPVMHYNSTGPGDNGEKPYEITPSENKAMDVKAEPIEGGYVATYAHQVPFPGKGKLTVESFGENFTVTHGDKTYKVKKIKVNKKKKKIQITDLEGADKPTVKAVKKATKGDKGLDYKQNPYYVKGETDLVTTKCKKNGSLSWVKVKINNKDYKAKKNEYEYDGTSKLITFKGDNLAGSYTVK